MRERNNSRGSQRPPDKWKQQGQDAVEDNRCPRRLRRVLRPDLTAEDRERGNGSAGIVEQKLAGSSTEPWLKRCEVWDDAAPRRHEAQALVPAVFFFFKKKKKSGAARVAES